MSHDRARSKLYTRHHREQIFVRTQSNNKQQMTPHPPQFESSRSLHRYCEGRAVVIVWEHTPLWLRLVARSRIDLIKQWQSLCTTPHGTRRVLIAPRSALSEEDRRVMQEWQSQRKDSFSRLNDGRDRPRGDRDSARGESSPPGQYIFRNGRSR
jgi:hypothetical protein